ncbi:hypothetical protein WA171_001574 [Blastocystis sp. BT1]
MNTGEEELRKRGSVADEQKENTDKGHIPKKEPVITKTSSKSYNVEKDPKYRWLFIVLKLIIVILALISFAIIFMNWIAPYLVSKEKKLAVLRDRLVMSFCVTGECSEQDWEDINRILDRARKGM